LRLWSVPRSTEQRLSSNKGWEQSSPSGDGSNSPWIFSSQLKLLLFMADHKAFTFTQRVLHFF
jgi:hypothetical protein